MIEKYADLFVIQKKKLFIFSIAISFKNIFMDFLGLVHFLTFIKLNKKRH